MEGKPIGLKKQCQRCPKEAGSIGEMWNRNCAGDLNSAMCGGQWAQVRKATVTERNITDKRCQLCFGAVGTLGHRFNCSVTTPEGGWPKEVDPTEVEHVLRFRKKVEKDEEVRPYLFCAFPESRHRPFDATYGAQLRKSYHHDKCT